MILYSVSSTSLTQNFGCSLKQVDNKQQTLYLNITSQVKPKYRGWPEEQSEIRFGREPDWVYLLLTPDVSSFSVWQPTQWWPTRRTVFLFPQDWAWTGITRTTSHPSTPVGVTGQGESSEWSVSSEALFTHLTLLLLPVLSKKVHFRLCKGFRQDLWVRRLPSTCLSPVQFLSRRTKVRTVHNHGTQVLVSEVRMWPNLFFRGSPYHHLI